MFDRPSAPIEVRVQLWTTNWCWTWLFCSGAWNLVGRVHFNLAENRRDEAAPFAFMATYTTRLSGSAQPQHLPLGRALKDYAGAGDRERLLSLLDRAPVPH